MRNKMNEVNLMRFQSYPLRIAALIIYGCSLVALPLFALWGWRGFLASLPISCAGFLAIRVGGVQAILRRLGARRLCRSEAPAIHRQLDELSRKLGIQSPALFIIAQQAPNIASVGFRKNAFTVVVTTGLMALPREECIACLAREILRIKQGNPILATWISQGLRTLTSLTGVTKLSPRKKMSARLFFIESVLWPVMIVPFWLLSTRIDDESIDLHAAALCGQRVKLASAYRKIELTNHRSPLSVGISERHLFLLPPSCEETIARLILDSQSLTNRIATLEIPLRTQS
jgi:heat shock protein HtpX